MKIAVALLVTFIAGIITAVSRHRKWTPIFAGLGTIGGAVVTLLQIIKELKALGWIS